MRSHDQGIEFVVKETPELGLQTWHDIPHDLVHADPALTRFAKTQSSRSHLRNISSAICSSWCLHGLASVEIAPRVKVHTLRA